ncbi:hypothetical protein GJAV_G00034880 [Gymnothorax javanicus]|nr:hypothetical protein GJAV_G00034880 [Gymnothorax javanicus]
MSLTARRVSPLTASVRQGQRNICLFRPLAARAVESQQSPSYIQICFRRVTKNKLQTDLSWPPGSRRETATYLTDPTKKLDQSDEESRLDRGQTLN